AQAQVDAAQAALRQAQVGVSRAKITAPFNAIVLQESVDLGQVVAPGAQLARLVGTDAFWVQVSIPLADLKWLSLPQGPEGRGSPATVTLDTGDGLVVREGHLVRLLGDLDPVGRLARVVVQIDDPLALKGGGAPLLLGAFVEVSFQGKALDDVVEVPRLALHEGDQVWLFQDGRLVTRQVEVSRRLRDSVLVRKGLSAGDQLIVSRLASPIPGMPLRLKGAAPAGEAPPTSAAPGRGGKGGPAKGAAAPASQPASRAEVAR
ncbi:MAG: efflux RND transporter periplasmic adaptor subunit, partial [Myxococcales bacterium]|nr:efflux RND transporter periplasmic adaptor subunit [Myxococcales bacterium]